jgi:hypothetical protein
MFSELNPNRSKQHHQKKKKESGRILELASLDV